MRSLARTSALLAFCGLFAACSSFSIFEDVGADPHPPQVQLLGVAYQPVALEPEPAPPEVVPAAAWIRAAADPAAPVIPPPVFLSPDAYIVRPNDTTANTLLFRVHFSDVGGDILFFRIRDRDGVLSAQLTPVAPIVDLNNDGVPDPTGTPAFFAGVSGTADLEDIAFPPGVPGVHRLEIWAEDSHGSRSEKVNVTVTLAL